MWWKLLIIFTLSFGFICLTSCQVCVNSHFLPCHLWISCFIVFVECFLDIVKVVIPPCAFCTRMQILFKCTIRGGAILFSIEHSSCDPYQVCVDGRQAVSFWYLCHHATL